MEKTTPQHFRLFIAVTIPKEVKEEVERAQAALRRAVPGSGIRWTSREQFHLTLRFLGNVEAHRVEPLTEALQATGREFAVLRMRAEGMGFFPDARFPRVVWAGVRDEAEQLVPLQRAIQAATAEFTSEEPEARFTGHLTLGRVKHLKRPESEVLAHAASAMAEGQFGVWTASHVELMRSELSSHGARHTCLAAIPLIKQQPS